MITDKTTRPRAPALPENPMEYNKGFFDRFNNVLRLYFRQLDTVVRDLMADINTKAFTAVTGDYTLTTADFLIEITGAADVTVTLPTAVGIQGREYEVKHSGTGVVTVDADGTETIDGSLTQTLSQYDPMKIMSNGTNWIIV